MLDAVDERLDELGVDYEICGMLWMQGESDSETTEMANAYEENLMLLVADIRQQTDKETLPIVMGRISSSDRSLMTTDDLT